MILRFILACAAVTAVCPAEPAFAQVYRKQAFIGDVRLSLFGAYSPSFTRQEDRLVTLSDRVVGGSFESVHGRGYGGGAIVEVVAVGRVRALTSLTYVHRSAPTVERSLTSDTVAMRPGSSFVTASAGLSFRIGAANPDMHSRDLNVSLRAGPSYIVEIPGRNAFGDKLRPLSAVGATVGIEAEMPIGRGAVIQIGAEDLLHSADGAELGRRVDEGFARQGISTSTAVRSPTTHLFVWRAGLGITFR